MECDHEQLEKTIKIQTYKLMCLMMVVTIVHTFGIHNKFEKKKKQRGVLTGAKTNLSKKNNQK